MAKEGPRPKIASVSLLARVMYSDGTVASMMLRPTSLGPQTMELSDPAAEVKRASELIGKQAEVIQSHLVAIGAEQFYIQAKEEAATRRAQVNSTAEKARDKHARKKE